MPPMKPTVALTLVKIAHTLAWAFFVSCIIAIPVYAWINRFDMALVFIGIVLIEALILIVNGWRCPLTDLASRFSQETHDGFDIYLPEWLARHNKTIFTIVFILGILTTAILWSN